MNKEKIIQAGKIAKEVKAHIRPLVKKGMPLLEIAEKIESKIKELGGNIAFPTNLSINTIAAHYTPTHDDTSIAHGLIKIDMGVHVDGYIADTAFSLDLENNEENKKIIQAAEHGLKVGIKTAVENVAINKIGKAIQTAIESHGFSSIVNLSGHSIERYQVHAGMTIPNMDDGRAIPLKEGSYAIEPFATNGGGKIYDGAPSNIYVLMDEKNLRSPIARELLKYIQTEYGTFPFCSRWLVKKFGIKALFGLKQLEENRNLHHFSQLVESSNGIVAQAEHTIIVEKDKTIVTT